MFAAKFFLKSPFGIVIFSNGQTGEKRDRPGNGGQMRRRALLYARGRGMMKALEYTVGPAAGPA